MWSGSNTSYWPIIDPILPTCIVRAAIKISDRPCVRSLACTKALSVTNFRDAYVRKAHTIKDSEHFSCNLLFTLLLLVIYVHILDNQRKHLV